MSQREVFSARLVYRVGIGNFTSNGYLVRHYCWDGNPHDDLKLAASRRIS